jgi:hypothetical protein
MSDLSLSQVIARIEQQINLARQHHQDAVTLAFDTADACLTLLRQPYGKMVTELIDEARANLRRAEEAEALLRQPQAQGCRCGVPTGVSHYCSALNHCWVGQPLPSPPAGSQ